jgi:hypothetical protein
MNASSARSLAAALLLCLAGTATADMVTTLEGLEKGAALPAGQAALLIVLDRGIQGSAVKRPMPVTMELVAVADGARFRVTDAAQVDVLVVPPERPECSTTPVRGGSAIVPTGPLARSVSSSRSPGHRSTKRCAATQRSRSPT